MFSVLLRIGQPAADCLTPTTTQLALAQFPPAANKNGCLAKGTGVAVLTKMPCVVATTRAARKVTTTTAATSTSTNLILILLILLLQGTKCENSGSSWRAVSTCVAADGTKTAPGKDGGGQEVCKTGGPLPFSVIKSNRCM